MYPRPKRTKKSYLRSTVAREESGHRGGAGSSPFFPPILHMPPAYAPVNMREMFSSDCWGMLPGYPGLQAPGCGQLFLGFSESS